MSDETISPLRRRMIEDMTVRNFSADTQRNYIRGVKNLAIFLGRSPDTVTPEELRLFQLHLTENRVRPPTINATVTALRFFFNVTVQCLGWLDGEILGTQLPGAVPKFVTNAIGARAIGFFVTTEDGSSPANRIISGGGDGGVPVADYSLDRLPPAQAEHTAAIGDFTRRLLHAGLAGLDRYLGLAGSSHALGSMVTGTDPRASVVDPDGRVHGMAGLYVSDGSVLPRSSRVNPALTIYAWRLRLGEHLAALA